MPYKLTVINTESRPMTLCLSSENRSVEMSVKDLSDLVIFLLTSADIYEDDDPRLALLRRVQSLILSYDIGSGDNPVRKIKFI
jgi:hypothetical protein